VSEADRETERRLNEQYLGADVKIEAIEAGVAPNTDRIPFAFHIVSGRMPGNGEPFAFARRRIEDSLRLAELELGKFVIGNETRFKGELLTAYLPSDLRDGGWSCAVATREQRGRNSRHSVVLIHPEKDDVEVATYGDDILGVLEDAAIYARHGIPGEVMP
jgi:hypothetical protein